RRQRGLRHRGGQLSGRQRARQDAAGQRLVVSRPAGRHAQADRREHPQRDRSLRRPRRLLVPGCGGSDGSGGEGGSVGTGGTTSTGTGGHTGGTTGASTGGTTGASTGGTTGASTGGTTGGGLGGNRG